ncbi:Importin-beta protein [Dictyocaulus viviparus]|uniref:Exportin-2 n=1 Tax=Dictyocaulus viviparus TaxID=29172 RepID=A0A0D8XXP8_DICVI|nr:Importin-beta protein [Dictyocaulus viviparus]
MEENIQQVTQALQGTLEQDPIVRKQAENRIWEFGKLSLFTSFILFFQVTVSSGFATLLLQLVCTEKAALEIRMAAAVALKNFIRKNWSEAPEVDLTAEEEEEIRNSVLQGMFLTTGTLQNQLSHAVQLIAKRDFPSRWPVLVPSLVEHLKVDDLSRLVAALSAMDQLFRKFRYETKSTALWTELKSCLLSVQEPLTQVYVKMVEFIPQRASMSSDSLIQWLEILCLVSKVFHSLCFQDLPEYFEASLFTIFMCNSHALIFQDNLKPWMDGFIEITKMDCPGVTSTGGEPTFVDELKMEVCEVFTLYAQRFEEEINPFMQNIIEAVWQLVVHTGNETRFDGMVCAALEFLSIICEKAHYESYFVGDGVLQTIAQDVCVKNLHLRQEDLEMFEDEPIEYMKRDIEGTDACTRRRGAIDLVRALCRKYEGRLVPILSQLVQLLCSGGEWMKLDVVYCLVTAIASKTETAKSGVTMLSVISFTSNFASIWCVFYIDVGDYYTGQVRGHLSGSVDDTPILKADALKFVVTFRNQLSADILIEVVQAADRILTSRFPILQKYAAYALDKLLLVKQPNSTVPLLTAREVPVGSLLNNLVRGFDNDPKAQNSPYLIKAILRCVAILDGETARHGSQIASKLSSLVAAATKNPADAVHTHFLFETMCVLIKKTESLPDGGLDAELMPLIETILGQDVTDLVPYALQITGKPLFSMAFFIQYMTYVILGVLLSSSFNRSQTVDQKYVTFLPFLLSKDLWARSANIPAALSVVELRSNIICRLSIDFQTFLKRCPEVVMRDHSTLLMQHFSRLIGSKSLDQYGFQLAIAILPAIEMMQGIEDPMSVLLNSMFQRVQFTKTPKFMKYFVVFLCQFAIIRGSEFLAKSVEAIQTGMFRMLLEKVVIPELTNLQNLTTMDDKRTIAIGIANMLADATNYVGDQYGSLAAGTAQLIEAPSVSDRQVLSPEEEQASMYNAEGEFVNPYCRLSYAPRADSLVPEISNFKNYLARAVLQRGPAANSAVELCISAELRTHLMAYA